uniref:Uncharacterized protein n=1 Tax=Thermogemmatispora argillosa TaxID=2045280 RepID=A0A455T0D3_9CHLR|nr:hypothetical protein KTA_10100 [Thermogemmatispora argillosa]
MANGVQADLDGITRRRARVGIRHDLHGKGGIIGFVAKFDAAASGTDLPIPRIADAEAIAPVEGKLYASYGD